MPFTKKPNKCQLFCFIVKLNFELVVCFLICLFQTQHIILLDYIWIVIIIIIIIIIHWKATLSGY